MDKSGEMIIYDLADILEGHQIEANNVIKSLDLIKKHFGFDWGAVYEADKIHQLNINPVYQTDREFHEADSAINGMKPEFLEILLDKSVNVIDKERPHTSFEKEILEIFSAARLCIAPITDENSIFYGMVVFANKQPNEQFCGDELRRLTLSVSMLLRYLGLQVFQQKLDKVQTSFESILDNTGIDIYVNDFKNHDILYMNKSMAAPYGDASDFIGKKCWQVLFAEQNGPCEFCPQKKIIDEQGNPTKVYTWDYQRAFDGSWFRVFSAAFRWIDGRLAHVVSSADITDNKQKEAMIQYMAHYDELTKLPNRRMLLDECKRRINNVEEGQQGYVLFFDIDGFKVINDTMGHDAGDEFLIQLGHFFSSINLLKDSIYRNGGDEFIAIMDGDKTSTNIRELVGYIHQRFKEPWNLKGGSIYCNTSVGVACYPNDGTTAEELMMRADHAMYHVKKQGGGAVCFVSELEEV